MSNTNDNFDEDFTYNDEADDNEQEENTEDAPTEEEVQKLTAENGILRRKLTKLQKIVTNEDEETKDPPKTENNEKEVLELRLDGYSKDEALYLSSVGGAKALENPYHKKTIEVMREQAKAEQAANLPDNSKEGSSSFSDGALEKMTADEYRKKVLKQ